MPCSHDELIRLARRQGASGAGHERAKALLVNSAFFIFVHVAPPRDLDGTFGLRGDRLRDRTQRPAIGTSVTVRADDDQVSAPTLGLFDNGVFG